MGALFHDALFWLHMKAMTQLIQCNTSWIDWQRESDHLRQYCQVLWRVSDGRLQCTGLIFSYWGSKYLALRRAQKPSALGNDVTAAINLLIRLLPLVQMILMYRLYFQVCLTSLSCLPSPLYHLANLHTVGASWLCECCVTCCVECILPRL